MQEVIACGARVTVLAPALVSSATERIDFAVGGIVSAADLIVCAAEVTMSVLEVRTSAPVCGRLALAHAVVNLLPGNLVQQVRHLAETVVSSVVKGGASVLEVTSSVLEVTSSVREVITSARDGKRSARAMASFAPSATTFAASRTSFADVYTSSAMPHNFAVKFCGTLNAMTSFVRLLSGEVGPIDTLAAERRPTTVRSKGSREGRMNRDVRRKLAMAKNAHDFSRENPLADAGYGAVVDRLAAAIAQIEAGAIKQEGGYLTKHSSTKRRQRLRRRIQVLLVLLVAIARDAANDVPVLLDLFRLPGTNASNATYQALARKLLEHARTYQEPLVQHGLIATLPDDLAAALTEFDRSLTATAGGLREHVSASAEMDALSDEVTRLVGMLDGINRYRFEREPEKLIAWESARHVETGPEPKEDEPASSSAAAPATSGEVKPA